MQSSDRELGPAAAKPEEENDIARSSSASSAITADRFTGGTSSQPVGPKVVKVDSALKSLVPAALRVKRPALDMEKAPLMPLPKSTRQSEIITSSHTVLTNGSDGDKGASRSISDRPLMSQHSSTSDSKTIQDDAYAEFMNEISMLGASGDAP